MLLFRFSLQQIGFEELKMFLKMAKVEVTFDAAVLGFVYAI